MRPLPLLLCLIAGVTSSVTTFAAPGDAAAPTTVAAPKPPFEDDIIAFEEADKKTPPPLGAVLFTGSSSIRMWSNLAQDFPELTVLNRGFGGSHVSDSVRNVNRITIPYKPKMIVIYAGTNDVDAGKGAARILGDFEEYVTKVHAALPDTRIVYISINPSTSRIREKDTVEETNNMISAWIRENNGKKAPLTFIDTYSFLLGQDGKPRPEILRTDGLHLNDQGYREWAALLRPQILELAGVKPAPAKTP